MKRYILVIAFLYIALGAMCEMRVSPEEAKGAALQYYQLVSLNPKGEYKIGEPERFSLLGKAEMWLIPINGSWILVSSDKRTEPILAHFSSEDKPDLKSYPPASQYLIGCYEYKLAYLRDSCQDCLIHEQWNKQPQKMLAQTEQAQSLPSYVTPLLGNLAWKQHGNESYNPDCDKVYNKYCPSLLPFISDLYPSLCGHAVVGCVAVAVGQIMHYWGWPYMADVPLSVGGIITQKRFYEWEKMPNSLYNTTPMNEVNMTASFLRDLGYNLDMDYGTSSGASIENALNTFLDFGYDETTMSIVEEFDSPYWENFLRSDLASGRPIFYVGYNDDDEGHAFVVDGYNTGGLFHINLGWGTLSNGYYDLNSSLLDFPFYQEVISGIRPDPYDFCNSITIKGPLNTPLSISNRWGITRAGSITFNNVTIEETAICRAYSATEIRLTNGTHIKRGSNVKLAIKDVPCNSSNFSAPSASTTTYSPPNDRDITNAGVEYSIHISSSPASDIIRIISNAEITFAEVYSIDGHCVIRSKQTELNISHLPSGVYVIRAQANDGQVLQTKFIQSKK